MVYVVDDGKFRKRTLTGLFREYFSNNNVNYLYFTYALEGFLSFEIW